ncbi:phosphoribosylamine--glycine ligase [Candidatus Curtissbacteria bacterium RIFCSPHIGHO2_01_FULL_41_11]|uniref:phosphoribosylamine--glycine ligase n=1 Tax=Candidatus Curtissbacteria bacterium RIFCSPHIGHO2_01_FULL_41_11 TaxID=1797711 RepID=A0A1F5G3E1_9BACT|nr:MAG: phosphoribosylamine--glycine ligase [Candidatus Curtissbacteria bacterium RIFCSPHIGHO2_01_FULL_41_11]
MVKSATVLVVDAGGRGAALIHKYSQSKHVGKLLAVPGNDLMGLNTTKNLKIFPDLKTTDVKEIVNISKRENVTLVDVAQDNAVEAGLTDHLIKTGIMTLGPTRMAGQIEWDKAWARNFMKKYKIPTPVYRVFNSTKPAKEFISKNPNKRFFIKAAGLAEGKGAIPAENTKQAFDAIDQMSKFKKAGETFLIEQWLDGEEFSMFAITDGKTFQIVGSAQDHKRLYDADKGPNTGGIGCSTPPLIVNENIYKQAELIIKKTIQGLAVEGRQYKGVLYLGAIVVNNKVFVIEFNARWGSPEAEVLVPGIQSDIFEIAVHVSKGTLDDIKIKTDGNARVAVTGSLKPGIPEKQRELFGLKKVLKLKDVTMYGARVKREKDRYFVSSGRLFHVVAEGKTVIDARKKVYEAMSQLFIEGDNLHYRTDIGWRDLERLKKNDLRS